MRSAILLASLSIFVGASELRAELVSLEILERKPFAEGKSFGDVGPYERIVGIARFAVDPMHPANRNVVDLNRPPRTMHGKVEFAADFAILTPKDPSKGNGAIFYDVNNRGNKLALRFFNNGGGNDLSKPGAEGDGFLMRRGYTVVWCGWIGELLPGDQRLLLQAPIAKEIVGAVRFETGTDTRTDVLPLSRREGHGSYSPTKAGEADGVLTVRKREKDPRKKIPRDQWSLERKPIHEAKTGLPGTLNPIQLRLQGGFEPGAIYELICECENPLVQGTGFLAVRDLVSFLQHDATKRNPIRLGDGKPALRRTYAFGVSQSGRFLRHYLYEGFNEDEAGQPVFAGMIPHVAGGGLGFFNHRFAQPTRHNGQHEEHSFPADIFPFAYSTQTDPFTKRKGSALDGAGGKRVKIMHTQSAAEYWHRSGSLVHTDPLGKTDADVPANVRIYAFGGTQHGPASDPPGKGIAENLNNPADYRPFLRALLDAMDQWVTRDTEPPASIYPRIDHATLANWDQKSTGFPSIPGVRYPTVIQQPSAWDYGRRFPKSGIIDENPPKSLGDYVVLVPKSGTDGNDLGCLLPPEVRVPLATYTGWNLRRRDVGAEEALASLLGSYLPFPRTKGERKERSDPRLSIEERYGSFETYRKEFEDVCRELVRERYLLEEDARRLIASRERYRELFPVGK